jgi:hypothetical protein
MRLYLGGAAARGVREKPKRITAMTCRKFPENGWALFGLAQSLEAKAKHVKRERFGTDSNEAGRART